MIFSMQFQDTPIEVIGEENSGEVIVETAGYVDSKTKIENMIFAGQRLEQSRDEYYDFNQENQFDEQIEYDINPTRRPGFDMAEASEYQERLFGKFLRWKKR